MRPLSVETREIRLDDDCSPKRPRERPLRKGLLEAGNAPTRV